MTPADNLERMATMVRDPDLKQLYASVAMLMKVDDMQTQSLELTTETLFHGLDRVAQKLSDLADRVERLEERLAGSDR